MTYERAQCIIFFATPADSVMRLDSVPNDVYAFLPEIFINNHLDVVRAFQQNNIHVLRSKDKPRILADDNTQVLEYLEIFLDDSLLATVDPLLVGCDEDDACLLFHIFSKTSIQLKRKRDEDLVVRPITSGGSHILSNFLVKKFLLRRPVYEKERTNLDILFIPAQKGQAVLAGLALDYGVDIDHWDKDGWTALHRAASRGESSTIQTWIERGASVDCTNVDGYTPLYYSINEEIARILLDGGANVNGQPEDGWTPLHSFASKGDSYAIIRLLIERGADVHAIDHEGYTPLHIAWTSETAEMFLLNGADPNAMDCRKRTPIFSELSIGFGSVEFIRMLLKHGGRVDVNPNGDSVLKVALKKKQHHVFLYLLERFFLDPVLLSDSINQDDWIDSDCDDILSRHVLKIQALNLQRHDFTHFDANQFQVSEVPAEFRSDCEVEVARMKSQTLCGTAVTVLDVLEKNDYQLACLLRNDSFAQIAESDEWLEQYPIYGSILSCHFENGKLRKSLQEEGMKICSRLFPPTSRPLPVETKDKILSYLSNDDLFHLKRTVFYFKKSVSCQSNTLSP